MNYVSRNYKYLTIIRKEGFCYAQKDRCLLLAPAVSFSIRFS